MMRIFQFILDTPGIFGACIAFVVVSLGKIWSNSTGIELVKLVRDIRSGDVRWESLTNKAKIFLLIDALLYVTGLYLFLAFTIVPLIWPENKELHRQIEFSRNCLDINYSGGLSQPSPHFRRDRKFG